MNFFITIFFSLATFLCANPIYHSFDDGDKAPLLQDNIMSASVTNTLNEKSKAFDSCGIGCASDTIRSPQKRNACPARSTKEPRPQNSVEGNREILPQDLQNPATNTPTRPFAEDGACDDHFPHVKHLYCGGPIIRRFPFDSVLNCVPYPVKPIPQRHPFRAANKVAEACCEGYREAKNQGKMLYEGTGCVKFSEKPELEVWNEQRFRTWNRGHLWYIQS